jgi:NADPH:quinone reductase-like Zn-dependent oxidoreductase
MKLVLLLALFSLAVKASDDNVYDFPDKDYEAVLNSRNFTGKVVLVTGSSSGIGEGIVKLFATLEANVVVTGRKAADVHKVAQEVQQLSPQKLTV